MSDQVLDKALEYFLRRKQFLEDEILRRQMALEEINLFIATAQDGRTKLRRDAKRSNSGELPATPPIAEHRGLPLPDTDPTP